MRRRRGVGGTRSLLWAERVRRSIAGGGGERGDKPNAPRVIRSFVAFGITADGEREGAGGEEECSGGGGFGDDGGEGDVIAVAAGVGDAEGGVAGGEEGAFGEVGF